MDYYHKEYPKLVDKKDYWAQIRRTVNGKPVSENDIKIIVSTIIENLSLNENKSNLLDLGCGNGALTSLLYKSINYSLGVDFSEYLINVAKNDFEIKNKFDYLLEDAEKYLLNSKNSEKFNKVLMYGCFAYFKNGENILKVLKNRFKNIEHVFIGNLPDLNLVNKFYSEHDIKNIDLFDCNSTIGIWRSEDDFKELANKAGWEAKIVRMPENFYASHYRYDALLIPKNR